MRVHLFASAVAILVLGAMATRLLERAPGFGFLEGALKLGGGLLICGLFSLRMKLHGLVGAGILALLGAARGLANLPDLLKYLAGDRSRGIAPVLELAVTVICALLLAHVIRLLARERLRRMLEAPEEPPARG